MKKIMQLSFLMMFSATVLATGTPTEAPIGQAGSVAICNTIKTDASVSGGVGESTSRAGMSSGASATVLATPSTISGSTNSYNNGMASNESTGVGTGSASATGKASADAAASFKTTVPDLGTVKLAGAASSDSLASVKAGVGEAGTAYGESSNGFSGIGSVSKADDGSVTVKVSDVKSGASWATTTGTGQTTGAGTGTVVVAGQGSTATGQVFAPKCTVSQGSDGSTHTSCE